MQSRLLVSLPLFALGALAGTSLAQDSSAVGKARVALDIAYVKPVYSTFTGTAAVMPFVNEHWQVGVSPTWEVDGGIRPYFLAGGADAVVNYFPLGAGPSRPYFGAFASQRGASYAPGSGAYGFQAGWLRFLSPSIALRSELRFRHDGTPGSPSSTDFLLTFDPYLFGRADRSLTKPPSFGVFDATMVADYAMRPRHALTINSTVAPFVTRWLQAGATANMQFAFYRSSGTHALELFGRGYLPIDTRAVPFADAFVGNESIGFSPETRGSHGVRTGVRTYLTRGVALDVALQWRRYDGGPTLRERTVRATLTTQFRARRAPAR
ncbi:MAG TPA: hypothetical protein VH539_15620 [Gemmatimonadaceae bacterium]|jgi:hypothetical protein